MTERAQDIFADVLLGELGVCSDVEEVREVPILQPVWEGSLLGYNFRRRLAWWFIDHFEDNPAQRARNHRAADEIRAVFLDLAKLSYAETSEAKPLPDALIRCLECRVVAKLEPTLYEMATSSIIHPTARVSRALKARSPEESWQTR